LGTLVELVCCPLFFCITSPLSSNRKGGNRRREARRAHDFSKLNHFTLDLLVLESLNFMAFLGLRYIDIFAALLWTPLNRLQSLIKQDDAVITIFKVGMNKNNEEFFSNYWFSGADS